MVMVMVSRVIYRVNSRIENLRHLVSNLCSTQHAK